MKIGVSSYSFSKYMRETGANYFKIADIAKEMGFEGIEFIELSLDVKPAESQLALAKEIRAYCESISLPIVAYTIGADFIDRENEVERLKGQVDVAEALGVKVMRHDVSWRRDLPWREMIARTADQIREVTEYAATKGITTCSENHGMVMQTTWTSRGISRIGKAARRWLRARKRQSVIRLLSAKYILKRSVDSNSRRPFCFLVLMFCYPKNLVDLILVDVHYRI